MRLLQPAHQRQNFANPPGTNALLSSRSMAPVWLVLRLYVGWQWLLASWHKLAGTSSIGWVRDGSVDGKLVHHGDKLFAFWQAAVAPPKSGVPQIGYPWYREFLLLLMHQQAQHWFAYLIAGGEFTVGLCLVLGGFTALAAGAGALLNFNYMLAGSASLNPVRFAAEGLLLLAWKTAGYVGLDRWLLPLLGTPWQPGQLLQRGVGSVPGAGRIALARSRSQPSSRVRVRSGRLHRRGHLARAR